MNSQKVVYATFYTKDKIFNPHQAKNYVLTDVSSGPVMYKIIRNILFLFPAEPVHHFSMTLLSWGCRTATGRKFVSRFFSKDSPAYEKKVFGLAFPNPIGLGAGFDKNARYLRELETLGFGFVEIGTVTPLAQPGNEKPRLFRLPKDRALINRMGFNNEGALAVAQRLRLWKAQGSSRLVIGGNIGKNKQTPNEEAWRDYERCFLELTDCVDYFVVNVSSPNTPGLRALQGKESLRKILTHLQGLNESHPPKKPLLLKIAPDLTAPEVDDVIELAVEIKLDGLVVSNTTVSRDNLLTDPAKLERIGAGGLSGAPLRNKSTELVGYIHQKTGGNIPIIASGGVFTPEDAVEKIAAGASLLQVWTGFIYEGPGIVKKILSKGKFPS